MPLSFPHATRGNRFRLFTEGDAAHGSVVEAVEGAAERVWLETYIFEPDPAGFEVLDALTKAARRGCDVLLMIDRFGSKGLHDEHVQPLRAAGGEAYWFNPLLALRRSGKKVTPFGLHRDHRKILVVDTGVAYTGGQNVSMQYGGPGPETFYDLVLRTEGPAAQGLAAVFLETLEDTTRITRPLPPPGPEHVGGARADVLTLDLREREGNYDVALAETIRGAEREVLFCSPYLLLPRPLRAALLDAADRGVDVRVLTAGRCDLPYVRWAARARYERLLLGGLRLYEMWGPMLHAKFCTADRAQSVLGSYNADLWGRRYNQEVGLRAWDAGLAERLAKHFFEGTELGFEVTLERVRSWSKPQRLGHALTYALTRAAT